MKKPVKTAEEVLKAFKQSGVSIGSWAKSHGYSREAVYRLLQGRAKATYGESHRIAVALGMKEGHQVTDPATFNPAEHREAA